MRRLSKKSSEKIEEFFRKSLNDENFELPIINFYTGKFTKILTRILKIHGITIGRRIFILPTLLTINSKNQPKLPADLVVHEIAHVLQYRREGFLRFIYKYLRDYRKNLRKEGSWNPAARSRAYFYIPFEIEAREMAAEFCRRNRV